MNRPTAMGWTITLAVCMLAALSHNGAAQPSTPSTARSTLAGVYSAAQASRGRDEYLGTCRSCHTPETHTGVVFQKLWAGRALYELYAYVSEKMPKNDPGSLSPEVYADLVAYLLRMNAMPVGPSELPVDSVALTRIRIVLPKKKP